MKFLSARLAPIQVTFLRFAPAAFLLLPFMLASGQRPFHTKRPFLHLLRSAMLFSAVTFWCYGLSRTSMPMAVLTNFAMPLILIVLASIVLGERIPKWRWAATAIGFLGIAVIFKPHGDVYHWALVPLILSAFCFALLDVLNRRYANSESMWAMLFYVFMGTALLAAIPAAYCWQSPTAAEWFLVALMAVGANLLSFCSMRALRLIEASATAPYRYVEFLFSIVTGYVFFGEIISRTTLFGAAIILPTTVLIAIYEARNSSKK